MKITRDVISDLWPLYESGEASDDTRHLIDDFLEHDREFANLVRESPDRFRSDDLPPLTPEKEIKTIQMTKRFLKLRDWLFILAAFLTLSPLTVYDTSWGRGWVIRDHPPVASALILAAGLAWLGYFRLRRRLSTTGM
jgi:hypothetical protein